MKKIISLGAVLGVVSPLSFVFAVTKISDIFSTISSLLSYLMPLLITFAAIWFVWNVIQYLISGDEEKKKKAKGGIVQGLIGLFVIIAFWGIISIFMNTFNIDTYGDKNLVPNVPTGNTVVTPTP